MFQETGAPVTTLSTLSGNATATRGGGDRGRGRLHVDNALDLANATVSGNGAGIEGGGIYLDGAQSSRPAWRRWTSATSRLTANSDGGIRAGARSQRIRCSMSATPSSARKRAARTAPIAGSRVITSGGGNLESGTSCGFTAALRPAVGCRSRPDALGGYGGRTLTHDLLAGSPAIDAGRPRICKREANGKDQRGLARFYDGNGDRDFACDSGAVEVQGLLNNPGFEDPLDAGDRLVAGRPPAAATAGSDRGALEGASP